MSTPDSINIGPSSGPQSPKASPVVSAACKLSLVVFYWEINRCSGVAWAAPQLEGRCEWLLDDLKAMTFEWISAGSYILRGYQNSNVATASPRILAYIPGKHHSLLEEAAVQAFWSFGDQTLRGDTMDVDTFTKGKDTGQSNGQCQKFDGICFHCSKKGHMAVDCWSKARSDGVKDGKKGSKKGKSGDTYSKGKSKGKLRGKGKSKSKPNP